MNSPTLIDPDLVAMMESVFSAHQKPDIAATDNVAFDGALWKVLDELGLVRLTGSESHGGSGANWHAVSALLAAAAGAAVPVPVVEHDLLAGWLLETAELPMTEGFRTAFLMGESGTSPAVPWGRHADFVVPLRYDGSRWLVADLAADRIHVTPSRNLGGEPRDAVQIEIDTVTWSPVPAGTAETFLLRGALARVLQACGAMERIVELCIEHVSTRGQFGRPLSKFQAVQRLVTGVAAETSLARAAADAAVSRVERDGWHSPATYFAVAVAKSCTGHAASTVVRNAHQVHGAIGTTCEHQLHRYTLPVLAWRSEFGSVGQWDQLLTRTAVDAGRDGAWSLITEGGPVSGVLDIMA
ncbi:acyl-CoA dehydrogenase family protein [Rhodococcus opacus]|uniref:acyl-CoA dehydrogenase family protein n=1 Tax=Rhodococcus opacus TaxID=37919 RepID=UPI001B30E5EC|nr:acyl-CoA dehydrogenase family protein [Rhodococcus opacus]UNM99394.1 acyl-CoA/acyl-ACP dehydrogenase [Rhodococcus opacus]